MQILSNFDFCTVKKLSHPMVYLDTIRCNNGNKDRVITLKFVVCVFKA